ncbi:SigE family RNA polymerase sigma factor [Yinghuangia soli]|uniref:SigE family RNA polymerase sigma factor n=1 Tax=Yinghuangia soli TaxID=2908204 RepID=A0AA41U3W5_9ACTN|nr:SigE family RNA polymerase sigma factor [Yinghuangia soli]MCF2532246.1 SigE family RNA polymerase sigma factor [Yinghuangia soli]
MDTVDEAEFREYAAARWERLVRIAYLLTGDRHHAEDLAQTALEQAYAGWHRVARSENRDAYVHRILVRCNARRFRKRRVGERLTDAVPEVAAPDAHAGLETRHALLGALAELPARQRAVIVLRYWSDLSEQDVAAAVGCSVGTVKSQASKGLAKLRSHPVVRDLAPAPAVPPVPRISAAFPGGQ